MSVFGSLSQFNCFHLFFSIVPEKRIYDNLQFYKDTLRTLEPSRGKGDPGDYEKTEEFLEVEQPPVKDARAEWKSSWEFSNYEKMCRGEARELVRKLMLSKVFLYITTYYTFMACC